MTALHLQAYKDIIERVVALRRERGLSQEELARRLPRYGDQQSPGQLQSFVSKFEQRQRRLDFIEFMHLCHVLGVRTCELLGEHLWAGEPPPPLVPVARETLLEDRARPAGRAAAPAAPAAPPATAAATGDAPGFERVAPLDGASQMGEAPGELPRAADRPPAERSTTPSPPGATPLPRRGARAPRKKRPSGR